MTYVSSHLQFPVQTRQRRLPSLLEEGSKALEWAAKRRVYYRTCRQLHGYSQRSLLDIGADRGVEEFARRAAGL